MFIERKEEEGENGRGRFIDDWFGWVDLKSIFFW